MPLEKSWDVKTYKEINVYVVYIVRIDLLIYLHKSDIKRNVRKIVQMIKLQTFS